MKKLIEIAIVDDKKENREQVKNSLSRFHVTIKEFESYQDFFAFYTLWVQLPSILVLDYFLERGKTGLQLLEEMQRVFWPQCNNVAVVGFSSIEECSRKLAEIGHGSFLKKIKWEKRSDDLERMVWGVLARVW